MRITGCDIWPLQSPTCKPSTMHRGPSKKVGSFSKALPYWRSAHTSIYSFNNNRGEWREKKKKEKEGKRPAGRCADISRRCRGGGGGEGRSLGRGGGLGCAAVWRKYPSVGPSEQHLSPETERTRTSNADINASSHSDLHLIITPPQRPFVISAPCRFPHLPTPPFFWQNAKKKKKEMEIYYINIPYVMAMPMG